MEEKLNRKGFLRVCAVAAAGSAVAACQGVLPEEVLPTPTPTTSPTATSPAPSPTPQAGGELLLNGDGADAWTWVKQVKGKINGPVDCQEISISVNGLEYPASREDGEFSASVPLAEGENRILAICRDSSAETGLHSELRSNPILFYERLRKVPTARISISLERDRIILHAAGSTPADESGPAIIERIWSARSSNPAPLLFEGMPGLEGQELSGELSSEVITLAPPDVDGEYYLQLRVKDQEGREDTSAIYFIVEDGQPRIPDYDKENPSWVESAIVYGVIPFLFGRPAFQAITGRLDELVDLGVNALWLAPINLHPADDYGYAVENYFEPDPPYGTKEDFHRLVQSAHARGIRVLMDFVPSHTSDTHPYFLDAQARGPESSYWEFYQRDAQGNYTYYFEYDHLPNLNYDNPEVRRWMIEAFSYWVREFDVDGFRVDFAWAIRERRPDFWPEWRRELKRIKPDLLLLAEASARDPFYFDNGFDAAYDWTGAVGSWAWELVWSSYKHRMLSYNLHSMLTNRPEGYHPDALIFRFLNNNDTGERFITRHGDGMTRVATAMLLTLPGIPCIYTGDEYGLEFEPYQELTPLTWMERIPGLRAYYQKLIGLRKATPSLRSRQWSSLVLDPVPQEVYGYIRHLGANDQPVLVLLNFFDEPAEIGFELPEEFRGPAHRGTLIDLLNDERVSVSRQARIQVTLPGLSARILAEG
jgi:cyclomaltodextrinase / maltogenic alpha-amylase / neopullulanase